MNDIDGAHSRKKLYEKVARILGEQFNYDMTPAEAVDYLAVEKADIPTGEWADVRGVAHSSVSGNVSGAKDKINTNRLEADVTSENGQVIVTVTDQGGEEHQLPFRKETPIYGQEGTATLTLVYECMGAVHGHYVGEDGQEFESTLWGEGQITSSFSNFDFQNEWGSPKIKADTILWSQDNN